MGRGFWAVVDMAFNFGERWERDEEMGKGEANKKHTSWLVEIFIYSLWCVCPFAVPHQPLTAHNLVQHTYFLDAYDFTPEKIFIL